MSLNEPLHIFFQVLVFCKGHLRLEVECIKELSKAMYLKDNLH